MSGSWWWSRVSIEALDEAFTAATEMELPENPNLEPFHPYYPEGVIIPDYEPNEAPMHILLASLGGMLGFALLGASAIALKINPKLSKSSLALFCWFIMSKLLNVTR